VPPDALTVVSIFLDGGADAVDQVLVADWLFQKIEGAFPHGFHHHGNVGVVGDQDHGQDRTDAIQVALQL
jgi:hypothetical protein